jgi:hypothetical protein
MESEGFHWRSNRMTLASKWSDQTLP